MALLKFLKGNYAGLSAKAISEGQVLICGDTGEMFVDVAEGKRVKIGDFIVIPTLAELEALDATAVPASRLYYVEDGNILARSNGTSWIQINKQKTLAELGGVALGTYNTKIGLLEQADTNNANAISDLTTYVGTIPETAEATNIVAYVQEKTAGIATDTALEELTGRVATAESDIDKLEAALGAEGETGKAVAAAKDAADQAQAAADAAQGEIDALEEKVGTVAEGKTVVGLIEAAQAQADKGVADAATAQAKADEAYTLANGKATMDEVETAIADAGHAVKTEVDQAFADMETAYKAADTALETKLQGNIDKKVESSVYEAKVAEIEKAISDEQARAEGIEGGLETRLAKVEGDYLKAADKTELQNNIDTVSGALERLTNGVSTEEIDGVNDLIEYVNEHGAVVTGMQEGIADNAGAIADLAEVVGKEAEGEAPATGLVKDIADNAAAIATEKARAEGKEAELAQADIDNLAAAKKYTDDEIAELKIGDYAKQADLDAHTGDTVVHITAAERTAWNAAEGNAKAHADGLNTAMNARVEALEAIDHDHENKGVLDGITAEKVAAWDGAKAGAEATAAAALSAAKSELEGKITAEAEAARAAEKANADAIDAIEADYLKAADKTELSNAIALKADASSVYTKAEVDTLLTWGSF